MIEYVLAGLLVVQGIAWWFERKKLLNRVMAKDYEQYQYYEKKYGADIKEVKKVRDEARQERGLSDNTFAEDEEALDIEDAKKLVHGWDEDWSGDLRDIKTKED